MTKERFQELLKPIADGLFGKQRTRYGEMPHYTVRPVGMIVEDLCRIPEDEWAKYAFSREPLNGKFNDEQRLDLTRQAIACGREYAEKLAKQYGMRDPEKLAKQLGLNVDYPDMPQNAERVLDIAKLLLGHELFHFVEEKYKKEIWTRTYKIELWAPKPLHNRSGVSVLGEIAAMSFAKTLTGISYSPYVMDAFLVYGYSPEAASGLYEEMMEKTGRTPRLPEAVDTDAAPEALPE